MSNMKPVKVIEVWQSMHDDNGGTRQDPGQRFFGYAEAKKAGSGWGENPEPRKVLIIQMEDGTLWELGERVAVFKDQDDLKKQMALGKLTTEERKLLGL
jgi:hypothetical protein